MVFSVIGTGFSQFAERRPEPMIPETQQMNGGTEIFFFYKWRLSRQHLVT